MENYLFKIIMKATIMKNHSAPPHLLRFEKPQSLGISNKFQRILQQWLHHRRTKIFIKAQTQ